MAFMVTILGGFIIYIIIFFNFSISNNIKFIHNITSYMWFIVPISTQIILNFPFKIGKFNLILLDIGWVELFGAQGVFIFLYKVFTKYQVIQYSIIIIHLTLIILFFIIFRIFCFNSLNISMTLKLLR